MIDDNEFSEINIPVQQATEGRTESSLGAEKETAQGFNGHANGSASVKASAAPMFAIPSWHKPYAEAVMEANPEMQGALIQKAERAILHHTLEMGELPPAAREYDLVDLGNAVNVLSQLKGSTREA